MKMNHEETLNDLYNLILNPGTRKWERSLLSSAKNSLEDGANFDTHLAKLEADLRPLALRGTLTPDVTDFYRKITGTNIDTVQFDLTKHYTNDLTYQDSAVFAGGCFWCMVEPFETLKGIVSVLSGYTGGDVDNPTYDQVSGRHTGHVEAVEIIFDTRIIKYEDLLELYWQLTDPTDEFGQFQDRGSQYRPIIFVRNEKQQTIAEKSKQRLVKSDKYKKPIVTLIQPTTEFWPAENYHQQFYKKNPGNYKKIERARQQLMAYQRLENNIRNELKRFTKKS
ncbi:peptide-methionine (S)-S-oxide reductase MsrA [Carnobacterium funditum]|uniref:peptide-methionine (S)-S-oxide reductase MsrA n=1 Tax=Carnobacterium funditum TaxID=2752 RepID=UPI0005599871|nr:peptide-methionine (S)-S-oxide reductase MsrA [Carnobacterium funditum]